MPITWNTSVTSSAPDVSFGALSLAGADGLAAPDGATSISDAGGTNLVISGGIVSPGTGGGVTTGVLTFNNGAQWNVTAQAGKYGCASTAEIAAAWAAASTSTATGILVRPGDYSASAAIDLPSKAFTNQFTIQPHTAFAPAATPLLNTYDVTLPGMLFGNATQNVRVYGLSLYETLDDRTLESNGVVEVAAGGTAKNVTVESCRIRSRDFFDAFDSGIFADSVGFTSYATPALFFAALNAIRGVVAGDCDNLQVLNCDIQHVTRGVFAVGCGADGANKTRIKGNYFQNVISNFTTVGAGTGADGIEIENNRMMHVWGSDGEVPSNPLHSAVGLSFDGGSGFVSNVLVRGNLCHVGWSRKKYTLDSGRSYTVSNAATGMKCNDPTQTYTYRNFTVAHNLIVSHGICMEFSGAQGVDIYNNTLSSEDYSGVNTPSFYFQGCENLRMWNNLGPAYIIGPNDGGAENGQPMVFTGATSQQYGNWNAAGDLGGLSYANILTGDAGWTLTDIDINELGSAYTPIAGVYALTAAEKKGALGTGYWDGTTDTAPAFSAPSTAATPLTPTTTVWDGTTYLSRSSALIGATVGRFFTFAWQGQLHADIDGVDFYFLQATGLALSVRRLPTNKIRVSLENSAGATIFSADTVDVISSALGKFAMAFSVDLDDGRISAAINGNPTVMPLSVNDNTTLDDINWTVTSWAIHRAVISGNVFKGNFDAVYVDDSFIDLDTSAGLATLFASDGLLKDVSVLAPLVLIQGETAAAINGGTANAGTGGAFVKNGSDVTDAP